VLGKDGRKYSAVAEAIAELVGVIICLKVLQLFSEMFLSISSNKAPTWLGTSDAGTCFFSNVSRRRTRRGFVHVSG
jgi:hypothetical protein